MKKIGIGLVGLLVLGVLAFVILGVMSRNGTAPGLVDGRLMPCPSAPNCVSSEADTESEKKVDLLPPDTWIGLPAAVIALGGTVTAQTDSYLAAEFSSDLIGFVDDLELRLAEDGVHVRSASRVGYSDAGVNAARVMALRERVGQ